MSKQRRRKLLAGEQHNVKVRCGGQMHTITMMANGALSLVNHPRHTKEGREVCKALETLGEDKPRCFEVMAEWRRVMNHKGSYGVYPHPKLPPEIQSVATRLRRFKRMRRSRRNMRVDPLARRTPYDFKDSAVNIVAEKLKTVAKTLSFKGYNALTVTPAYENRRGVSGARFVASAELALLLGAEKRRPKTKKGGDPGEYWMDNFQTTVKPLRWLRLHNQGLSVIDGMLALDYGEPAHNNGSMMVSVLRQNSEGRLVVGMARIADKKVAEWFALEVPSLVVRSGV